MFNPFRRGCRSLHIVLILAIFCPACRAQNQELFKAYELDFANGPAPQPEFSGIAKPAKNFRAAKDAEGMQITVDDTGLWRGYFPVGSLGPFAGYAPLNGGERLHVTYSLTLPGPVNPHNASGIAVQYYGGETVEITAGKALDADGKVHEVEYTLPDSAKTKHICALWVRIDNPGPGAAIFRIKTFSWDRRRIDNRLDADTILHTPPPHTTRIADRNGAMAIMVDDRPITGLGWADVILQNVSDQELQDMVAKTDFKLARLIFTLGESITTGFYPPTWLGPDQFDFSYLDQQMGRILHANPQTKVILQVALDGAKWWVWMHPDSGGVNARNGVPDYLSPAWQRDSRDAIRQMVAHVQTSPYAGAVIGYQLMNGATEDCNFEVNDSTPAAVQRYRAFLREKYKTEAALREAWGDPAATFDAATPQITAQDREHAVASEGAFSLLLEPARSQELIDKIAFHRHVYQQVILNFVHDIKEAAQGRVIAGARTGDLMGNVWNWPDPLALQQFPSDELLASPDFDYFEVQEPYIGRGIADYGSGVPEMPPQGLAAHKKLIVIQNDVRTHLSAPTESFGRTPDLPSTLAMQRRVFINAMVLGMSPYLWQQSYHYNDPQMLADFRKHEEIYHKSLYTGRSTDAEVAFVFDDNYTKYFGSDPQHPGGPGRGLPLFDYSRFPWARAGAPFDMILLDQLPAAKPYKVYVFVHTVGLTDSQREMIRSVVGHEGKVAIFIWADGLIDGKKVDAAKMSELVGMKLNMSASPAAWQMKPTAWFRKETGVDANYPIATVLLTDPADPNAPQDVYAPSFTVSDPAAQPIATYNAGQPNAGGVGIAVKRTPDGTSIYNASAILTPALLRYAIKLAGAHLYTDTDDHCYINQSFIGFNARQTHTIHVTLPQPGALYDVFRDQELPPAARFDIPVERGQTYLFFRGDRSTWQQLGQEQTAGTR